MALIPTPKEVIQMGRLAFDPDTGMPTFPAGATEQQIDAYWDWQKRVKAARKAAVIIEE